MHKKKDRNTEEDFHIDFSNENINNDVTTTDNTDIVDTDDTGKNDISNFAADEEIEKLREALRNSRNPLDQAVLSEQIRVLEEKKAKEKQILPAKEIKQVKDASVVADHAKNAKHRANVAGSSGVLVRI